jgi:hypothetical protein
MNLDQHTLQQWVAGAEVKFQKSRRPLADLPLVNRFGRLGELAQNYIHTERIDLTRARDFRVQQTSEDLLVASIELPLLGKRGLGNDVGLAVASFKYTDQHGEEHDITAICAYTISGAVSKTRALRKVIVIPMI